MSTARERTRKRLDYAVKRREQMIEMLAPDLRCAECQVQQPHARDLVVDHVNGITWDRYKMSPQMRAARYHREHAAGVSLRALCTSCSVTDGNKQRHRRGKRWKEGQKCKT